MKTAPYIVTAYLSIVYAYMLAEACAFPPLACEMLYLVLEVEPGAEGVNIVVVDNDKSFLRSLSIVLSTQGHRVTGFDDPLAACLELEAGSSPDLILLDYMMPGMNGLDAWCRIRPAIGPGCRAYLVTGHAETLEPEKIDALGFNGWLPKPLDLDRLTAILSPPPGRSGAVNSEC